MQKYDLRMLTFQRGSVCLNISVSILPKEDQIICERRAGSVFLCPSTKFSVSVLSNKNQCICTLQHGAVCLFPPTWVSGSLPHNVDQSVCSLQRGSIHLFPPTWINMYLPSNVNQWLHTLTSVSMLVSPNENQCLSVLAPASVCLRSPTRIRVSACLFPPMSANMSVASNMSVALNEGQYACISQWEHKYLPRTSVLQRESVCFLRSIGVSKCPCTLTRIIASVHLGEYYCVAIRHL